MLSRWRRSREPAPVHEPGPPSHGLVVEAYDGHALTQNRAYQKLVPDYVRRRPELRDNRRHLIRSYITPQIPRSARILDLGCGTGEMLALLQEEGFTSLTGVDQVQSMIEEAGTLSGSQSATRWHVCDLREYVQETLTSMVRYDVIILQAVIHLFPILQVLPMMREIIELSRGRIYWTTPLYDDSWEGVEEKDETGVKRFKHHYSRDELDSLMELIRAETKVRSQLFLETDPRGRSWAVILTEKPKEMEYLSRGFRKLETTLTVGQLAQLRRIADRGLEGPPKEEAEEQFLRYGSGPRAEQITRLERLIEMDPEIEYLAHGDWLGMIGPYLSDHALLWKDKLNYKPPNQGVFPPHQDERAGWPPGDYLNLAIALDQTTAENGSLHFVAGGHDTFLSEPKTPIDPDWCRRAPWERVDLLPGQMIIFSGKVPHFSGPNTSNHSRRMLFLTYSTTTHISRERFYWEKIARQPPVDQWDPELEYRPDAFGKYLPVRPTVRKEEPLDSETVSGF